ncbi:MAG: glycoside hydrolase family 16 [Acidobacteriaceae bacterium]|nr:glycoside hydrolase family 16 [Acidobacteriaceae bacterium]
MVLGTSLGRAQCGTTGATGSVTWTTQWCDEFNGALNSPIDSTKWTYDTGNSGFGNNELETYCDPTVNPATAPCSNSNPNAYIDGSGHLAIQVRSVGSTWTSARLKTAGKQSFKSGRIEANLQIPSHAGLWPAFWNLGSQPGVTWPTVGESDVMENWPTTSNIAGPGATGNCSTIHTQVTAGIGKGHCFTLPSGEQIDTAFHTYGQIWSANMIQYYIDDPTKPYFVVTASDLPSGDAWPFSSSNNPFFIIMNIAVGGTLGAPTDSATGSQAPMLVDYVRQYVPSPVVPQLTQPTAISLKAGASSGNTTTLNLTQTQGTGRTAFSCTTPAPKASCLVTTSDSVNQYTVDFSNSSTAAATVTVTTTANTASAGISSVSWLGLAGATVLALTLLPIRRHGKQLRLGTMLGCLVLTISAWPACGGGSGGGGGGGGGGGSNGTTPGSYTVTVNAYTVSSSDAATPSASTNFNLTVN